MRTVFRTIVDPRIILGVVIAALALSGLMGDGAAGSVAGGLKGSGLFALYADYLRGPIFNYWERYTGLGLAPAAQDAILLYVGFSGAVVGAVSVLQARDLKLWKETEREAEAFVQRYPNFDWEQAESHLVENVGQELTQELPPQFPMPYTVWRRERPWYYRIYPNWPGLNYIVGLIVGVVTIPFMLFAAPVRLYRSQELVSEPGAYSVIYSSGDQLFGLRISVITQIVLVIGLFYVSNIILKGTL